MDILLKVPVELKRKIIGYMVRPPHYTAYINGMRPVFDNELFTLIDGETEILTRLDLDWYEFLEENFSE